MPTRLDIEAGAEHLLPFAKKKLAELDGLDILSRFIYVNTGERIYVQKGEVALIRIRAAPAASPATLYNWAVSPAVETRVTSIELGTSGSPIVAAGGLTALGAKLSFSFENPNLNQQFFPTSLTNAVSAPKF